MKQGKAGANSIARDAAVAAAAVAMDEFFPHCPNGMVHVIHERLSEIVQVAIEAALAERVLAGQTPSVN